MLLVRNKNKYVEINSESDVKELLNSSGQIKDIEDSLRWLKENNEPEFTLSSGKNVYTLREAFVNKSVLDKAVDLSKCGDIIACPNISGETQYFTIISLGKNGHGDFVKDDLTDITRELLKLKLRGISWISMTNAERDIPDDVSYWGITFTI
jgi:hypothetical protein